MLAELRNNSTLVVDASYASLTNGSFVTKSTSPLLNIAVAAFALGTMAWLDEKISTWFMSSLTNVFFPTIVVTHDLCLALCHLFTNATLLLNLSLSFHNIIILMLNEQHFPTHIGLLIYVHILILCELQTNIAALWFWCSLNYYTYSYTPMGNARLTLLPICTKTSLLEVSTSTYIFLVSTHVYSENVFSSYT